MRKISFWLSLLLIFFIPGEKALRLEGLGTISRIAGLASAAFWIAAAAHSGRIRRPRVFHVMIGLFVAWNLASVVWSVDVARTLERGVTNLQIIALVLILWDLYTTRETLRLGMQAYVFGGFVCMVGLVQAYLSRESFGRLTVEGFNPNDVGFSLALGLPVAWYLTYLDSERRQLTWLRWLNFLYLPMSVVCIILTGSRAAFVSALAAFGFMALTMGGVKTVGRVTILLAVVGGLFLFQAYVPDRVVDRLASTFVEGSLDKRGTIWAEGLDLFTANPVLGIGSHAFSTAAVEARKAPHNFVISLLVEVGIVGLGLFIAILVGAVAGALRQKGSLSLLWLTVLLIWTLNAAAHNYEDKKQTWLFFSFAVIGAGLPQSGRASMPPSERTAGATAAGPEAEP